MPPLRQTRSHLARTTAAGPVSTILVAAASDPGWEPVRSLYVHVPFCFHKCHYCDFYSIVDRQDRQAEFTDRLIRELAALAPLTGGNPLRTIFVGGGTPSLLRPDLWERLLVCLKTEFDLSESPEFTVECNPETVTPELMTVLAGGGVNRVSIGAQSFDAAHLKTLERWHDPENVAKAVELARAAGINRQSVDLIFAVPGQTPAEWRRDLETALALGTEHLSAYCLTYEPGTALTARLERGMVEPAEESTEVEMLRDTLAMAREAGLERYEVSNYAKPGAESRHNIAYWQQDQWLAAGASGSAHISGHRWKNTPRLDDYLHIDEDGFAPIVDHEAPDPRRALQEKLMTGVRISEGLDARAVLRAAGEIDAAVPDRLRAMIAERVGAGHVEPGALRGERWSLTDEGMMFADGIAAELMGCV
ncbi:MAG: radical SAM family heme chaperone HemW [Planctomycetota bacterium]